MPWLELDISLSATFGVIVLLAEIAGLVSAFHALMTVRTAQGTIAWCVALVSFPLLSLPLYWVFGRNKFQGYVEALRAAHHDNAPLVSEVGRALQPYLRTFNAAENPFEFALDGLTLGRFTRANAVQLLIDGKATFDAIFAAIDAATDYVLVQFFIIKDDALGEELKRRLIDKAGQGVRNFVLYDEIGSHRLSRRYVEELRAAGAEVSGFRTTRGRGNRFQLNFRNHRKIVVVDGRVAFVGGHNVGDEYLGKDPKFGRWRDTHVRIRGPAVQSTQAVFVDDWYWATRRVPELTWLPEPAADGDQLVLALDTAPLQELEACALAFLHLISSARHRLWIASPYFVPDEGVSRALQLAALRGVDVRIMIPDKPDHLMVWLAAYSYFEEMSAAGVKMYRYGAGFLHQKVVLVDDRVAMVGTANLDNRSMRLNFEIGVVVSDPGFAAEVETMLGDDLGDCRPIDSHDYAARPLPFRAAVRLARLLSPVL